MSISQAIVYHSRRAPWGHNSKEFIDRVNAANPTFESWTDVYRIFTDIADEVLSNVEDHDIAHKVISYRVDDVYAQHEGEPLWDSAYERWYEPSDDDEEV